MVRDRSRRRCESRSLRSPLPRRMPSNGYRPEHSTRTTIGPSRPRSPLVRKHASFSDEGQGRWGTITGAISSDCGRSRGRRSREGEGVRRRPSREEEEKPNRRSFFRGEPLGSPPHLKAGPEEEQEETEEEEEEREEDPASTPETTAPKPRKNQVTCSRIRIGFAASPDEPRVL